jgi:UDP-N-acetylmuramyl tripeptide synthase
VATPLAGRLQLAALGRALEMAADAGISMARLLATVPTLRVATGWLEPVHAGQAFGLFVDAACDARGMESTLTCAREMTQGRLFVVTGPRPDAASGEMLELARVCGVLADAVVVTTDDLAPAEFALRAPEFAAAAGGPRAMAVVEADRHQALRRVCGAARAGDVVIVAGKATHPTQRMGDVLIPWDDRAHLGSVLSRMGYVGGDF